jgi:glycosyltransferase involved in cell wall biosynthesis
MTAPLTVFIAAAGQPTLVQRTLESLAKCEKPTLFRGTWIVENGPPSGIEAVCRARPRDERVQYLHVPEANKSHALNVALTKLSDGLIFFTDDDARFDPQLLLAYARGAWGASGGEFYGGPLRIDFEGDTQPPEWMRACLPKTAQGWSLPVAEKTRVTGRTFLGPNWAAFASDLWAIGGFEPRLGPGAPTGSTGQETDAQRRLLASGVKAYYLPDAIAWHLVRARCLTLEWIVERGYRHGLEWGIRRGRDPHFTRFSERLVWLRMARRRLICQAMQAVGGERWKLQAAYWLSRWQGRWDGIGIGRRWDTIAVPELPEGLRVTRRAA